jgi:hypothetical protein
LKLKRIFILPETGGIPMSERHVIGAYVTHQEALNVLNNLVSQGIDREKLTLLSPHVHKEDEILGFIPRGGVAAWGSLYGALWGIALGVVVAFVSMLPIPSEEPFLIRLATLLLFGVSLGGLAGLTLGGLTSWSLAPRFFISPDLFQSENRFCVVYDTTHPGALRARELVLTLERQSSGIFPAGSQAV